MTADKPHSGSDQGPASIVKTSSRKPILAGLALFAILFLGGGIWLGAANLSGAVIATGTVAIQGKPKTVQHLDGGIVAGINVSDGDQVKQGDTLVLLDDKLLKANFQIFRNRLQEAIAQRSRLIAERDEQDSIIWDNEILTALNIPQEDSILNGHQKLFEARRNSLTGQIARLEKQAAQFKNQISGVSALKSSKARQITMLSKELKSVSGLKEQGLVTNTKVMTLEREKEALNGQIGEHEAELARIANSINEAEIQVLQIERDFRQSVLTELREVEREVNEMTQQLQATVEQLKRVEIKAPVDGIIHELSVFTIGGVIGPGAPILQIIPQDEEFVIEANVEPQFIDELYPDQPATLRFSAFNQNSTPELNGSIQGISASVVTNEQTGEPFYKVRVGVTAEELARLGDQNLIPGMPVETFIKTRDRTALNYLVKPLLDQVSRTFREE